MTPRTWPARSIQSILMAAVIGVLVGCAGTPIDAQFTGPMERAHNVRQWQRTQALVMDIDVTFGGARMLAAKFTFETNGPRVLAQLRGGRELIYDGADAWVAPGSEDVPMGRFHVLTWPYFVYTPFKLRGADVHLADLQSRSLDGAAHPTVRMTFAAGSGDTPDDWYILYQDPKTHLLAAQSYIVTYGKSVAIANEEPHAITYHDYIDVDGVRLATLWKFWNWNATDGIHGEPIGQARLNNVAFVTLRGDEFDVPPSARRLFLPQPQAVAAR